MTVPIEVQVIQLPASAYDSTLVIASQLAAGGIGSTVKIPITSILSNVPLTSTYVGYGSASNVIAGTSDFTWTESTHTLSLANLSVTTSIKDTAMSTAGVVHNSSAGLFSSSLVINTDLATMPTLTIKGNNTGITATPLDLTVSQIQTMINGATGSLGTMAYENSNSITVTGGTINGTTIGATTPSTMVATKLDVVSTTSGSQSWPSMTTTQRLAISSPATNDGVFDTTLGQGMFWTGSAWNIAY